MNEEGQVCTGKSFSEALTLQGIPAFRDFTIRDPRYFMILFWASFHDLEEKKNFKNQIFRFFFSEFFLEFLKNSYL